MKKLYLELVFRIALIIVMIAGMITCSVAYNQIVYGDWTCGFKKCVVVKEEE